MRLVPFLLTLILTGCVTIPVGNQTKTYVSGAMGFFTKNEICSKATWIDDRGIISWRSNLDPFVRTAKKTVHRCSVGSHVNNSSQQGETVDQSTNSTTRIGKMARVEPSKYKIYNSNNSNDNKLTARSSKQGEAINDESAFAYATYDPSSIQPITCSKTGGLFGVNDKKCMNKISTTCERLYPKSESPKEAANWKTCGIKSLKKNYPKDADVNFLVPFLVKERAYYLLAHQGNISWTEATALNDQSVLERNRYFAQVTQERRTRGLALATLGFCIASNGLQNCLTGGSTTSSHSEVDGYLTKSYLSGLNRICTYNQLGSDNVITLPFSSLCPLSLSKARIEGSRPANHIGIFKREFISGHNKICVYDNVGSAWVQTIGATDLCSQIK